MRKHSAKLKQTRTNKKGAGKATPPASENTPDDFEWPEGDPLPYHYGAWWLENHPEVNPWLDAFDAIDKGKDKAPLVALLRSEEGLPEKARFYLADLIDRQMFPRKGRPRTAAYDLPASIKLLGLAVEEVRLLCGNGMSRDKAIEKVSRSDKLSGDKLRDACEGKNSSLNKARKRLPSFIPVF